MRQFQINKDRIRLPHSSDIFQRTYVRLLLSVDPHWSHSGVQIYSFYFLFPQSFFYNTNARLLSLVPSLLDAFLEAPIHSSLFNTNLKE